MTEITANELKNLQEKGEKILVQYTATWCGPCKALTPKLSNLSNEYENVTFVKIDVDNGDNADLVLSLGIMSVPTVIVYNGEKIIDRSRGLQVDSYYKNVLNTI